MKGKFLKSVFMSAAVAVAGAGCWKAYDAYMNGNESELDLLAAENVQALSESNGTEYRYPKREGRPQRCTLSVYISLKSHIGYRDTMSLKAAEGNVEYNYTKTDGQLDKCPDKGDGCNNYTCQHIPY